MVNEASIGDGTTVSAHGLTVSAEMKQLDVSIKAKELDTIDLEKDTIFVDENNIGSIVILGIRLQDVVIDHKGEIKMGKLIEVSLGEFR